MLKKLQRQFCAYNTMGSWQLFVLSFVLACVQLSNARFLSMSGPTYWGVEVAVQPEAAEPEREHSRRSTQQSGRLQARRNQPAEPFSWKYPQDPVDSVKKPPVKFTTQRPMMTNRVAVRCGENRIQVEVNQDLMGRGRLIKPEDIKLGGCSATEIDNLSHVLVFECELHACGSTLVMKENTFLYAFELFYNPRVLGRSRIVRRQSMVIGIECHYPR
ncbi:zona pellucida sperm-binding protein 3-like [Cottoperca gobio]|uniref:Zona pellucida sperm-binding protein 3-like n=1 Tax=Cottoperca gobio TaxID=56716 RepID=A0A6J2QZ13_COTGO|nr:zona pellucida sperm-binding protein 3-like [Cottoperca gobio]